MKSEGPRRDANMKHSPPKSTILAQIPVSPAKKRRKTNSRNKDGITPTIPQKMNPVNFDSRLKQLLSCTEFTDIFYDKIVLDIHHIIIVNWKIFQYEVMEKNGLWGRSRCFSTFNREVIVQGYQKVKFLSSEFNQKVLIYLRSVESEPDTLRSHIPCFIPAAEIRKKQASLNNDSRFTSIFKSQNQQSTACRKRRKCQCVNKSTPATSGIGPDDKKSRCKENAGKTLGGNLEEHKLEEKFSIESDSNLYDSNLDNEYEMTQRSRKRKIDEVSSSEEIHTRMYIDRLKFVATNNIIESLVDDHIKTLLEMFLMDDLQFDLKGGEDDVLLWDPNRIPEKQVVRFLKEWAANSGSKLDQTREGSRSLQTMNTRQPDVEAALQQLSASEYEVDKALHLQKLGKYNVFVDNDIVDDGITTPRESERLDQPKSGDENSSCDSNSGRNLIGRINSSCDTYGDNRRKLKEIEQMPWTAKMKLNFEKGLILFGEDVNQILEHFQCFQHLKPIHLDWYFYSNQRQTYINIPENSKKIVNILDRTPLKHLQKIEFFELGKDWAKMRQNIISSSSESSDDSVCTEIKQVNKFGRTVRTVQQKRRRRKRLPDRFMNFQM